jgi:hypothetical protein
MNQIFTLIAAFPNKPWDWNEISRRSDISFEYVFTHLHDHPWNWLELSVNPRIGSWKNVEEHPELPWSWPILASNPGIPIEIILNNLYRFYISMRVRHKHALYYRTDVTPDIFLAHPTILWNFDNLSRHPLLTYDHVRRYLDKPWNWEELSKHPNITLEDILNNDIRARWNIQYIFRNPNIKPEMIPALTSYIRSSRINDVYIYNEFSQNPNLNIEYAINNPYLPWNWTELTSHPSVTIQLIKNSPSDIPWCKQRLSSNPTLTIEFIRSYMNIEIAEGNENNTDWCWSQISQNPAFTIKDVLQNPDLPWNIMRLSLNIRIKPSNMFANPQIEWSVPNISSHPLLKIEDVLSHSDFTFDWDWEIMSFTPFTAKSRQTIQHWWKARCFKRNFLNIIATRQILQNKLQSMYIVHKILKFLN